MLFNTICDQNKCIAKGYRDPEKMSEIIYLMENGEMITADSLPDLDDDGWDTWWTCSQWVMWHKANKRKYGKAVADQKFGVWWNKQDTGSGPLDCRTFNYEFRKYIAANNLQDIVWEGAGILGNIFKPVGAAGDVITGGSRAVSGFGRALP